MSQTSSSPWVATLLFCCALTVVMQYLLKIGLPPVLDFKSATQPAPLMWKPCWLSSYIKLASFLDTWVTSRSMFLSQYIIITRRWVVASHLSSSEWAPPTSLIMQTALLYCLLSYSNTTMFVATHMCITIALTYMEREGECYYIIY